MKHYIDSQIKYTAFTLVCLLMMLSLLLGNVYAAWADSPGVPAAFYGTITVNGSAASSGLTVQAYVNGVSNASVVTSSGGGYGPLMVTGSPGALVQFYVGNLLASQTASLVSGGVTNLNLTVTGNTSTSTTTTTASSYTYNILSNAGALLFNNGVMTTTETLASADGRVSLGLANATSINMQGQYQIAAATESSPPPASDNSSVLAAYSFQPAGATFSPAAILTMKYDSVPLGFTASSLYIAYWTGSTWQALTSTANEANSTVSAPVSHFTIFSLRCPSPTPSTSSSTSSTATTSSTASSTTSSTTSTSTTTTGTIGTSILGTSSSFNLSGGNLTTAVSLGSNNGKIYFSLAANTAVNMQGSAMLSIVQLSSPPVAPAATARIIATYSCSPDNATFSPSATITIKYDTADIPTDVNESSLQIALLDGANWMPLSSSVVNTTAKTVTGQISHFSTYALMGTAPAQSTSTTPDQASSEAGISYSDLAVEPQAVNAGSPVVVTLRVINGAPSTVSKNIALNVNGVDEAQKSVDLVPGKSQVVSFNLTKSIAGTYNIKVGTLSSSFQVKGNTASSSKESTGIPWLLISGIVGGVIVVAIVIRILVMKSRGDL